MNNFYDFLAVCFQFFWPLQHIAVLWHKSLCIFVVSEPFFKSIFIGKPSSSPTKCNTVAASATFLQFNFASLLYA